METFFGILFVLLCIVIMFLHVFSLPANWILLVVIALWKLFMGLTSFSWGAYAGLIALAVLAEVLEFFIQSYGSRKFGASGKGNLGGIIGAIAGAVAGAGFFFGIGALFGALFGAFGGCLAVERLLGRPWPQARSAAWGAMYGKFFGLATKVGFGVFIAALFVPVLF